MRSLKTTALRLFQLVPAKPLLRGTGACWSLLIRKRIRSTYLATNTFWSAWKNYFEDWALKQQSSSWKLRRSGNCSWACSRTSTTRSSLDEISVSSPSATMACTSGSQSTRYAERWFEKHAEAVKSAGGNAPRLRTSKRNSQSFGCDLETGAYLQAKVFLTCFCISFPIAYHWQYDAYGVFFLHKELLWRCSCSDGLRSLGSFDLSFFCSTWRFYFAKSDHTPNMSRSPKVGQVRSVGQIGCHCNVSTRQLRLLRASAHAYDSMSSTTDKQRTVFLVCCWFSRWSSCWLLWRIW